MYSAHLSAPGETQWNAGKALSETRDNVGV
jgi:hypothetical protein